MPISFPALPPKFVGRQDYVARFKARLEHFRFFLYEGNPGVGKTALLLRLAHEVQAVGAKGAIFINVHPGERIVSILARAEAKAEGARRASAEHQGDPYARLVDVLEAHAAVLLLDDLENLRRDDLTTMLRVLKARERNYRIIGAIRGATDLAAMDRAALHLERVGGLSAADVAAIAEAQGVHAAAVEALRADAQRGGSVAQPLTLHFLTALLRQGEEVPQEVLDGQSARSVHAFKAVMAALGERLAAPERELLVTLGRTGMPVSVAAAAEAFGEAAAQTVNRGLVDVIDGDIHVHALVAQTLISDKAVRPEVAQALARHLRERATAQQEPVALVRAGDLLARAALLDEAVDTLASGWEAVRDLGFLESYLKTLALIPATGPVAARLKLLTTRARMHQGTLGAGIEKELTQLAADEDTWTKQRALAELNFIHGQAGAHEKVVETFAALRQLAPPAEVLLDAGTRAASALLRLGRAAEAEKLARFLLTRLKTTGQPEREGQLHQLLSARFDQAAQVAEAVREAQKAAECFEASGDAYHAALAFGSMGDLYRQAGEFERAREAFARFRELAAKWGDRDLVHIAELSDAWVALDVGDLPHAARRVEEVEREMSTAPSRAVKRYLAAAKVLVEAGRGHHAVAARGLAEVLQLWEEADQLPMADNLRAYQVRSHIALGEIDTAEAIVQSVLKRLDPETAAARVATFMRESAIIHLRRKDMATAMEQLAKANELFTRGGNRREAAMTLYRMARAAFEDGDEEEALKRSHEALKVAKQIKHPRAVALAMEIQARIALDRDDVAGAVALGKEALATLRRLGDELGALYLSEWLLRAELVSGDVAAVLRSGPRVCEAAQLQQVREVRVRAVVLTGIAMLRRGTLESAARCFRELPDQGFSAWTRALTWRLGEALASVAGDKTALAARQARRTAALLQLPEGQRTTWAHALEQLDLPPRERCWLRTPTGREKVGTEQLGFLDPAAYEVFADVLRRRFYNDGQVVEVAQSGVAALLSKLAVAAPKAVPYSQVYRTLLGEAAAGAEKAVKKKATAAVAELQAAWATTAPKFVLECTASGVVWVLPPRFAVLVPTWVVGPKLSEAQKKILKLLRRHAAVALPTLQAACELTRAAVRREVQAMMKGGLVETVRVGRGQAYRLA